jgi:hypothetical protein
MSGAVERRLSLVHASLAAAASPPSRFWIEPPPFCTALSAAFFRLRGRIRRKVSALRVRVFGQDRHARRLLIFVRLVEHNALEVKRSPARSRHLRVPFAHEGIGAVSCLNDRHFAYARSFQVALRVRVMKSSSRPGVPHANAKKRRTLLVFPAIDVSVWCR